MSDFDPWGRLALSQREQLETFETQLAAFNRRHNLVSPATIPHTRERHTLHALALALRGFPAGVRVADWGSGGGIPALPLATVFPDAKWIAVDAVGKKMQAVRTVARRLGLDNLTAWHGRAELFREAWPEGVHYSVSRATAPLLDLWTWFEAARSVEPVAAGPGDWKPGLICLKGGDLASEIADLHARFPGLEVERIALEPLLGRPYFAEKVILAVSEAEGSQ